MRAKYVLTLPLSVLWPQACRVIQCGMLGAFHYIRSYGFLGCLTANALTSRTITVSIYGLRVPGEDAQVYGFQGFALGEVFKGFREFSGGNCWKRSAGPESFGAC